VAVEAEVVAVVLIEETVIEVGEAIVEEARLLLLETRDILYIWALERR
jgi:hypothetical protein